jgi:lactoylglutathione lyase
MTEKPTPGGMFEAHLTVSGLDRAVAFYRDVVGLEPAFDLPDRGAAFLWIGAPGVSMLGLWAAGEAPQRLSLHLAFRTSIVDVLGACDYLRSVGVTPLSFFTAETDEPSVIGWMPAAAVYFRDPDGHLLEYLAMLDEAPRPDLGIVSWSQWRSEAPADPHSIRWHEGSRSQLRGLFELADDSHERIDEYIELGRVLVALDRDGKPVGHLQLVPTREPDVLEITSLAVVARHRRQGIGRRLVDRARAVSRAEEIRTVTVTTAMADVDNLCFYQRLGFRATSIVTDAFTRENGYPGAPTVEGIPLRDAIRFEIAVDGP